ncbi:hypothetical protein O0L34_g3486 [Tuta absoluta]|nr:hypothetical protein O0L34_g3486 [Tuta absoluta]
MTELDKFKRRLVRSVSRLLKQDQEQQDIAWNQMRKETGCDCKLLWERMRALTIKKIKRLLAAGDRNENIAAVARLSLTDWLLFDLVLVHEKLDVIGRDQSSKNQTDHPVLQDLFELVQQYMIECKTGDQLLEAWVALTRHYNSRGRQVSPLLLQRRWYQLKENTRANFYKLWNNYRGNPRLWDVAKTHKPTPLQSEIAKKYPHVITQPFPEWKELIEMKKVILPEQFELQSRMRNRPKTVDDNPDLVVIEPVIETIELGEDSDEDPKPKDGNTQQEVNLALVKQEPTDVEDGLSNVKILEATHIPMEQDDDNSNSHLSSIGEDNRNSLVQQMTNFMQETSAEDVTLTGIEFEETADTEPVAETTQDMEDQDVAMPDDLIKQKAEEYLKSRRKTVTEDKPAEIEIAKDSANADEDIMDDIIKQKADAFVREVDMKKLVHDVVDEFKLPEENASGMEFADDGIEFEDEGIEYEEEDDTAKDKTTEDKAPPDPVVKTEVCEENVEERGEGEVNNSEKGVQEATPSPKFDLKLLMEPVVYTTKLDDMILFRGKKFDFVELQNIIDSVIIESKPVSKRAIKVESDDIKDNVSQTNSSQADRSMNDDLFRNEILKDFNLQDSPKSAASVKETTSLLPISKQSTISVLINTDTTKSATIVPDLDDQANPPSDGEYESDEPIDESLRVKPTSYLLQKPRNRSYNPIILCKNPDFNTRLKRLTAGFFSSERNRRLLSYCKPMTIDLHKAFEPKLLNGTLYLKSSKGTPQPVREEEDEVQSSSVMPSAMPIKSLLANDQGKTNIQDLLAPTVATVDLTQRKKTVDLKDLSEIRRINQNLLTAEVPPMRVESSGFVNNYPPRRSIETRVLDLDNNDIDDEPKVTCISGGQDVKRQGQQNNDMGLTSYRGRGRGRGWWGGAGGTRGRGAIPKYKQVLFKPQHMPTSIGVLSRTPAPWLLRPVPKPSNIDDFLITIDTLNRMINKIDGTDEYKNPKKKNKRPNWAIKKDVRESLANSNSNDTPASSEARPINTIDVTAALNKPDSPVPDVIENVAVETTPLPSANKPKKKSRRKFCCYSREKLSRPVYGGTNMKAATWKTHPCPQICQCCCRDDLLDAIKKLGNNSMQMPRNISPKLIESDAIVLSDGECNDDSAIDDDSSDVRIPGFDPDEESVPKPRLRVYSSTSKSASVANCSHTNSTCTSTCTGRGYPMSVAGISTQTVSASVSKPISTPVSETEPQPLFRINVNFTPAPVSEIPDQPVVIPSITTDVMPQATLLEHIATQISPVAPTVTVVQNKLVPKGLKKVTVPVPTAPQRQIVIDASGTIGNIDSAFISSGSKITEDKILVLNSKALLQKPKESPIYLGKDTILLTTVKFPPNFGEGVAPNLLSGVLAPKPQVPAVQPKVVPPMPIPSGVQLVLMPDGQLTYSVEPTTTLDVAQLAAMPNILAAVQEQINIATKQTAAAALNLADTVASSASVVVSDKITDQTQTEGQSGELLKLLSNTEPDNPENVKKHIQDVSNATNNIELVDKSTDSLNDETATEVIRKEEDISTKDQNSSKESEIITIENIDEPETATTAIVSTPENKDGEQNEAASSISVENEINDSALGSRNLLSDLMEMSGISAEDTTLQESPTKQVIPDSNNVINPIVTNIVDLAGDSIADPAVKVVSTSDLVGTSSTINLPELSPITSLSELKYACDHNGLFYKLDLNTGVIAPINVCIKKNVKASVNTSRLVRAPVTAKGVIDLTDDSEIPNNITKDGNVKPIKLFPKKDNVEPVKIVKGESQKPIILKRNHQLLYLPFDAMQSQIKKQQRKQSLLKVDARINLVDSDAPMEEEYLVDSSDSDVEVPTTRKSSEPHIVARRVIESSDDSSDEEPLAKKFMRLRDKNQSDLEKISAADQISDPKDNAVSQLREPDTIKLPVAIAPKPVALASVVSPICIVPKPTRKRTVHLQPLFGRKPVPIAPKPAVLKAVSISPPKQIEIQPTTDPSVPIVKLTPVLPEATTDLPVPIGPPKPTLVHTEPLAPVVQESTTDEPEEDVDDNMNSDDMEIEESQFLAYMEQEESQEEDCILGV